MAIQIQLRRGTSTQWTTTNPILAEGELAVELDTNFFKIGDGIHHWVDLQYVALPVATDTTLGGIKLGSGLYMDANHNVSVQTNMQQYTFTDSTQWMVSHNMNTKSFVTSLTDAVGATFFAATTTIDANNFVINLTAATSGAVDVIFNLN
jgi:hypothetical protein